MASVTLDVLDVEVPEVVIMAEVVEAAEAMEEEPILPWPPTTVLLLNVT